MKALIIAKDNELRFETAVASKNQCIKYLVAVVKAVMSSTDSTKRVDVLVDSLRITELGETVEYHVLEVDLNNKYAQPRLITEKLLPKVQLELDDLGIQYTEMY